MDESGSVGLDLSFATHVFLMEPLADASLQAQVESRAHRMGAVKPIHVETFAMQVSIVIPSSNNGILLGFGFPGPWPWDLFMLMFQ